MGKDHGMNVSNVPPRIVEPLKAASTVYKSSEITTLQEIKGYSSTYAMQCAASLETVVSTTFTNCKTFMSAKKSWSVNANIDTASHKWEDVKVFSYVDDGSGRWSITFGNDFFLSNDTSDRRNHIASFNAAIDVFLTAFQISDCLSGKE